MLDFMRWQKVLTQEAQDFLVKYQTTALDKVALLKPKFPQIPFPEIVEQLDSLRKVGEKLPSWADKAVLLPSLAFQQASSALTAQYKSAHITGEKIADLTGGLGVDAYYLAQGGRQVFHIEANTDLHQLVKHNFIHLEQNNITFINQTAEEFLLDSPTFDSFYIDPARRGKEGQKLVLLQDYSPNIVELLPILLKKAPHIWLKTSPLLDIAQASLALNAKMGQVQEVYVIAVGQEVKELLFHIVGEAILPTQLHAVTLGANEPIEFSFTWEEEQNALPTYCEPMRYIYEPLPALLKAGAFKSFAKKFDLYKLHPNTHLYTSETLQTALPARIFELQSVYPYKKNILPTQKANITTRNFRDSVAEIRQKLRITEGGEDFIFATTLQNNELALLLTKKIEKHS
jgi:hypothetical protein